MVALASVPRHIRAGLEWTRGGRSAQPTMAAGGAPLNFPPPIAAEKPFVFQGVFRYRRPVIPAATDQSFEWRMNPNHRALSWGFETIPRGVTTQRGVAL